MVRTTTGGKIAFYPARTDNNLLILEYCGSVKAFRIIPDSKYVIAIDGDTIRADQGITELINALEIMDTAALEKIIRRIF